MEDVVTNRNVKVFFKFNELVRQLLLLSPVWEKLKGDIMTEQKHSSGLCINCSNADECRYRINHTRPIIFCEEFTCSDPSKLNNYKIRPITGLDDLMSRPKLRGLCGNCENLETCNLQEINDNVISCEEYR